LEKYCCRRRSQVEEKEMRQLRKASSSSLEMCMWGLLMVRVSGWLGLRSDGWVELGWVGLSLKWSEGLKLGRNEGRTEEGRGCFCWQDSSLYFYGQSID
jgi:hypothetical protein